MNAPTATTEGVISRWSLPIWGAVLVVLTAGGSLWLNLVGGSYSDLSPATVLIAYAPTIAAIVAVSVERRGILALLAQLLRWRAGARWYAIAVLGPLLIGVAATGLFAAVGGGMPAEWVTLPALATVPVLLGPIVAGSIGEEPGWRGFAQPRIQRKHSALTAAIIVGVIWALWHLWPALTPLGLSELSIADIAQTFLRLVSTSVIYAWLYNSTGALPVVLVAHAAHNVTMALMPEHVIGADAGAWCVASLYVAVALAVILLTSTQTLTRNGLSTDAPTRGRGRARRP